MSVDVYSHAPFQTSDSEKPKLPSLEPVKYLEIKEKKYIFTVNL